MKYLNVCMENNAKIYKNLAGYFIVDKINTSWNFCLENFR